MSKSVRTKVIAQVILIGSKEDRGLGPGVIGEADVDVPIPKTRLALATVLAYAEASVIEKFIKIRWVKPEKGKKPRVPRTTRLAR